MVKEVDQNATPDLEDVVQASGYFGRYHFLQSFLQMFVGLSVAFPLLSIVFIGYPVPHRCNSIENVTTEDLQDVVIDGETTLKYGECSILIENNVSGVVEQNYFPCLAGHNYSKPSYVSYVAEWDLVCERSGLGELSQTLMMLGQGFGLIFSVLADKYGRKPLYTLAIYGLAALSFGMAFSNGVLVYIIIRFLIGAFQQGAGLTAYTLFVETLSKSHRPLAGTIGGLVWSFSVMMMTPIAYAMQDYSWRYLQIALSCATLYVFTLHCGLDESVRWLLANNKADAARRVTKRATRMNGCDVNRALEIFDKVVATESKFILVKEPDHETELKLLSEDGSLLEDRVQEVDDSTKYSVLDIFRHKIILKTSAITWYIWTVNSLTYYGLFLTSTSLAGNRFLNFFLSAIVEVPGTLSVFFMLKRFGRRHVSMIYHFMAGLSLIVSVVVLTTAGDTTAGATTATVCNMLGKFFITGSFNSLFIYSPELFPTNLRNAGLGMGSAMSRVGGMTAPFSKQLAEVVLWGPGALFGFLCLLASFLIRYLPETKGRELPTKIEEIKEMYKSTNKQMKTKKEKH